VFVIQPPGPCEDNCGWGFYVDETYYDYSCIPIRPESLNGDLYAVSEPSNAMPLNEVRIVGGFDPKVVIAGHAADRSGCDRPGTDGWFLFYAASPLRTEEGAIANMRAQCDLPPPQQVSQRCKKGGPFLWVDGAEAPFRYLWRDDHVDRENDQVAAGKPSDHSSGFDAVASDELADFARSTSNGERIRSCVEIVESAPGRKQIRLISQIAIADRVDHSETTFVVEQLRGGPGWWVTQSRDSGTSQTFAGPKEARVADSLWEKCDGRVLVDQLGRDGDGGAQRGSADAAS